MVLLDFVVKSTFINIYFGWFYFIQNMHTQLIKQITDNVHSDDIFINDSGEISVKLIMIIL